MSMKMRLYIPSINLAHNCEIAEACLNGLTKKRKKKIIDISKELIEIRGISVTMNDIQCHCDS